MLKESPPRRVLLTKDSCVLLSILREVSGEVRRRSCSAQQKERFGSARPPWREAEAEALSWVAVERGWQLARGWCWLC